MVGALSSVGRASRLHREGRRFEPVSAHHIPTVVRYVSAAGQPAIAASIAARASLESALAINPEFVPALLNLGNLFEDEGDREAAKAAYAKALALQPGNILALTRVAEVTRFSDPNDPLIARLSAAVSRHGLTPIERADVGFALGRALDQAKKFDLAFSAYAEANKASRALARHAYDPLAASSFVDALIEEFDSTVQTEAGDCHDSPIFICGMFRSGSNWRY